MPSPEQHLFYEYPLEDKSPDNELFSKIKDNDENATINKVCYDNIFKKPCNSSAAR